MNYQVRISIETAKLIEELKHMYEERTGISMTKGNVLMQAFNDSEWVNDWKEIFDSKIKLLNDYEIKEGALRPKLQVSNEVELGIQTLKKELPKVLGVRSVTIGVCIRLILKAAFMKNIEDVKGCSNKNKGQRIDIQALKNIINKYKEKIELEYDEEFSNKVIKLLSDIEIEVDKSCEIQ
ncbi:hypothetical protein ACFMB7_01100 [Bacillus toyonensis]